MSSGVSPRKVRLRRGKSAPWGPDLVGSQMGQELAGFPKMTGLGLDFTNSPPLNLELWKIITDKVDSVYLESKYCKLRP